MANAQTSQKGNPASKRMTNANLKDRRERSWIRGEKRKAERVKAQKVRENENKRIRSSRPTGVSINFLSDDSLTPWELQKKRRFRNRHADCTHSILESCPKWLAKQAS